MSCSHAKLILAWFLSLQNWELKQVNPKTWGFFFFIVPEKDWFRYQGDTHFCICKMNILIKWWEPWTGSSLKDRLDTNKYPKISLGRVSYQFCVASLCSQFILDIRSAFYSKFLPKPCYFYSSPTPAWVWNSWVLIIFSSAAFQLTVYWADVILASANMNRSESMTIIFHPQYKHLLYIKGSWASSQMILLCILCGVSLCQMVDSFSLTLLCCPPHLLQLWQIPNSSCIPLTGNNVRLGKGHAVYKSSPQAEENASLLIKGFCFLMLCFVCS